MNEGVNTQEFFKKYQDGKASTSSYLRKKKFNTQAGEKTKQIFYLRLMPRIPNKPSAECAGQFMEFWTHHNIGPDSNQSVVCLNTTTTEYKSNKKRCPACSYVRKVLNNEENYRKEVIDRARKMSARNRMLWAVYDLASRKEVEFLEVSRRGNDKIINQFSDAAGEFMDLTVLKNPACLQIIREGSGINSEYSYKSLVHPKYALSGADAPKIKESYAYPESVIIRTSEAEFKELFESAFSVESSSAGLEVGADVDGLDALSSDDALAPGDSSAAGPAQSGLDALSELSDAAPPISPPAQTRSRERAPAAQAPATQDPSPTPDVVDDLMSDLDKIA